MTISTSAARRLDYGLEGTKGIDHEGPLDTALAILFVLATGAALTFAATRATANVHRGVLFLRWMVVLFAAYLALISLPILFGL